MKHKSALALALSLPLIAAYAGGWATVTVDSLPEYLVAGRPTNITFSIRQHGMNMLGDLNPRIEASSGKSDFVARAVATNREGYYTATVTPPASGDWTLTIRSGFGKSDLTLLPIPVIANGARPVAAMALPARGHALFVAKGCATCHEHARVKGSGMYKVGTDLTVARLQPAYLEKFLADPSIKTDWKNPGSKMPNLQLKPAEIASIIAFLNANTTGGVAASQ